MKAAFSVAKHPDSVCLTFTYTPQLLPMQSQERRAINLGKGIQDCKF